MQRYSVRCQDLKNKMARTDIPVKYDPDSRVVPFYSFKNITGQASNIVKTTGGFLHTITFNKPTATQTVEIADVGSATTIIGTVTIPASPMPVTLHYDIEFPNGLTLTTATASSDITVSYL